MGVEDNYFNITDLDSNTTFYSWVQKENDEVIAKLNRMNVYGVTSGSTSGINVLIGTTSNSGAFYHGGTFGLTGMAHISLSSVIPGVTVDGDLVVTGSFGFGGSSANPYINRTPNLQIRFQQSATGGFTMGSVVRVNSGGTAEGKGVTAAKANSIRNAQSIGIVRQVNHDSIDVITQGYVEGLSGLTAEGLYYLSGTADGGFTLTQPVTVGWISKPVLLGTGRTHGIVLDYEGSLVAGGDTCGYGCGVTGTTGPTGGTAGDPIFVSDNQLINGALDIWQRNIGNSTSHTSTSNTFFADRWVRYQAPYNQLHARGFSGSISSSAIRRYGFTSGQSEVLGEPRYYASVYHVVTGGTGATTNFIGIENRVEGGDKFVGEKIVVDGYIRVHGLTTATVPLYLKRSRNGITYNIEEITPAVTVTGTNLVGGKATARITCGGVGQDPSTGQIIFIRSSDGEGISYEVQPSASGTTAGFTAANVGGGATVAANLAIAIARPENHAGRITTVRSGSILYLTQSTESAAGNNIITENLANVTVEGFTGGQDHGGWTSFFRTHSVGSSGATTVAMTDDGFVAFGVDFGGFSTGTTLDIANFRLFTTQGGTLESSPFRQREDLEEVREKCSRYYQKSYDLDKGSGSLTMMTMNGPTTSVPDMSPIRFTVSPDYELYYDFTTKMRKTPTVSFYSPQSGTESDAYNRSAERDMRLTSGTYGYNNILRTHITGDDTLVVTPSTAGVAFFANSGRVVLDSIYVHYIADADHNLDL